MKWIAKGGKCMFQLQKELNITYKHLHELKHTFLALDWIYIKKTQNRHTLFLTPLGRDLVHIANNLFGAMDMSEADILKFVSKSKRIKTKDIIADEIIEDVKCYEQDCTEKESMLDKDELTIVAAEIQEEDMTNPDDYNIETDDEDIEEEKEKEEDNVENQRSLFQFS